MKRYEVQTKFSYGWENCWTTESFCGAAVPQTFDTQEEAQAELVAHLESYLNAGLQYWPSDFRIVEIEE